MLYSWIDQIVSVHDFDSSAPRGERAILSTNMYIVEPPFPALFRYLGMPFQASDAPELRQANEVFALYFSDSLCGAISVEWFHPSSTFSDTCNPAAGQYLKYGSCYDGKVIRKSLQLQPRIKMYAVGVDVWGAKTPRLMRRRRSF